MIFLIEYDRGVGKIVKLSTFSDTDRQCAQRARLSRELELARHGLTREVVLLEAKDQKALERTHRRYFRSATELAESDLNGFHPD